MKNKLQYLIFTIACAFMFTGCTSAGFERHFGFTPTEDVQNINYSMSVYRDEHYQLAFDCNRNTIDKIVENLELNYIGKNKPTAGIESSWWQNNYVGEIEEVYFYKNQNSDRFKYLWFDSDINRAYYLEYTI